MLKSIYFIENSINFNGNDLNSNKIGGAEKILINLTNELAKDKSLEIIKEIDLINQKSSLKKSEVLVTGLLLNKLESALVMWPELVPSDDVSFNAARLFGLAADVEIMILSL